MAKKRARGDSVALVEPASKKAKGAGSKATELASELDSVKVYAWCFEDMPFEDYRVFVATSSEDLDQLRTWKPKNQDDDEGLPKLMALEFVHHDGIEEDVKGKSRGIAELFAPFIEEDHDFLLYGDGEPDAALMEITLVKKLPRKGPFAAIDVGTVKHSALDGFEPVPGHILKEQGYSWVTAVRVERDVEIVRLVQKLVRAHSDGLDTLLEDDGPGASAPAEETTLGDVASGSAKTAAKVAQGANATSAESTSNSDVVKLYAWSYEDQDGQPPVLSAILPSDLNKFKDWKPKDEDDSGGLPPLIALDMSDHESLEDDIEDLSRDIGKLFDAYNKKNHEFWVYIQCEPNFALLEITLAKKEPARGPFVTVEISDGQLDELDGFMCGSGDGVHDLTKQGFSYITAVGVERNPDTLKVVQRLVMAHQAGVDTLFEDGEDVDS